MDLFEQILGLDQGRLVEQGTHMQLLDPRGLYEQQSPTYMTRVIFSLQIGIFRHAL